MTVTDALEREVAACEVDGEGEGTLALDTRRWAQGLYIVRLTAGTTAATARLTVVP